MVQTKDLLEKAFDIVLNNARDQDLIYFFRGFAANKFARRLVVEFFKKECDSVRFLYLFLFVDGIEVLNLAVLVVQAI